MCQYDSRFRQIGTATTAVLCPDYYRNPTNPDVLDYFVVVVGFDTERVNRAVAAGSLSLAVVRCCILRVGEPGAILSHETSSPNTLL
jgi:hypothetical protein